ncbi:MAG TPA: TSUP family transporter, partial [Candidatus Kapabacteria bacterium]
MVGGGGLIQIPVGLIMLPQYPVATVIGTTKLPSFTGTCFAAYKYSRHVPLNFRHLAIMASIALPMAFLGSRMLTLVENEFMKPFLLVVLTLVAVYTYTKKNFGEHSEKDHTERQHIIYASLTSFVIGFYDGFIGPGTGSFLILSFVTLLGYDFMKASATAKFINLATNTGSIILFALSGNIIYEIALPMMAANGFGGFLGARMAILRGNKFIR